MSKNEERCCELLMRSLLTRSTTVTSTMRGFLYGIAAVSIALFFGFGGGVIIADWLNRDAAPHTSKLERLKSQQASIKPAPALSTSKGGQEPNPLIPRKIATSAAVDNIAVPSISTQGELPLTNEPLGPSQVFSAPHQYTAPKMTKAVPRESSEPTTSNRREIAPIEIYRPEAEKPLIGRKAKRREIAGRTREIRSSETTGVAASSNEDLGSDVTPEPRLRPKKSARKRKLREAKTSSTFVEVERPTVRPMFGLFGF